MDNVLTVEQVFTERLLRLPDYQRGYAWEARQLTDFSEIKAKASTTGFSLPRLRISSIRAMLSFAVLDPQGAASARNSRWSASARRSCARWA